MRLPIFIFAILLPAIHSCNSTAAPEEKTSSDNKPADAATAPTKATLNHIAQYVVNLQISTNFYQNIIGLDTIPEPFHDGRHTWFGVGKQGHLHVISGATAATTHDKNAHLCFSVPSVTEFIKTLDKNNIPYENWAGEPQSVTNRVDGVKQIYFKDPDGYWIEINDAKD
jgi:lactoylglutathione lyase